MSQTFFEENEKRCVESIQYVISKKTSSKVRTKVFSAILSEGIKEINTSYGIKQNLIISSYLYKDRSEGTPCYKELEKLDGERCDRIKNLKSKLSDIMNTHS